MDPVALSVSNEVVPEKYKDVITYEFAYDPVRLPLDQDPTQSLYDRKILETIWETKSHAQNPMTQQWFNARSAISQRELRQEMEDYIKLQKLSGGRGAELDVIEDYSKILGQRDMKPFLDKLNKSLSKKDTTPKECVDIWKQINLLRLFCQFHSKNIETFRSLHGIRYLHKSIVQMILLMHRNTTEQKTKEIAWDVCKEITRAIDVVGLKPSDIHSVESNPDEKNHEYAVIVSYYRIIGNIYMNDEGYSKIESLMLRIFFKVFYEMNAQAEEILGRELSEDVFLHVGPHIATNKFSRTLAKDISSEDLYYVISILQTTWIRTSSFNHPIRSQVLVSAILICIAREIDRSEDAKDLSEGQLVEAKAERRYNSEALEKGLSLVRDILMTEGPSADIILEGSLYIVERIVHMFKRFEEQEQEPEPEPEPEPEEDEIEIEIEMDEDENEREKENEDEMDEDENENEEEDEDEDEMDEDENDEVDENGNGEGEEENEDDDRDEDESDGPLFCVEKGCKIFECIHSRIAQLGLNINEVILKKVQRPPPDDIEVLLKFVKFTSTHSV